MTSIFNSPALDNFDQGISLLPFLSPTDTITTIYTVRPLLSNNCRHSQAIGEFDKMAATHSLKVEKLFSVKDYVCVVSGGGTGKHQ